MQIYDFFSLRYAGIHTFNIQCIINYQVRSSEFVGKVDISRETVDNILSGQIEQLREISRINDNTASTVRESVSTLYENRIPIDTTKFEQLNHHFISEMENKLQKVKQPSQGLKWYIVMWVITLTSAFLAGYFIHEYRQWKEKAVYWYHMYEGKKKPESGNKIRIQEN